MLLYAIAASAWNIVGGYAGQVSVGHVVFFGCGAYAAMGAYAHFGLPPLVGIPAGIVVQRWRSPPSSACRRCGCPAIISAWRPSRSPSWCGLSSPTPTISARRVGLSAARPVPRNVFDLSFISALPYYYLFLVVLAITLGITWWMTNSRMGFYLRAIKDSERAARSLGAPAAAPSSMPSC